MIGHCTPWRGACLLLAAALVATGCGGKAADHGSLTLVLEQAGGGSPLSTATYPTLKTLRVQIIDGAGATLADQSFPVPGPVELDHAPEGPGRIFHIETRDASGAVLRAGNSTPVDLVDGDHLIVTVILS